MPDTITEVLQCTEGTSHPHTPHLHFRSPSDGSITYSRDLDYVSRYSERVPGVFGMGEHVTPPQQVAEHGSTPAWPVQPCRFRHTAEPHYHVTSGTAFDPESPRPLYNMSVHETRDMHTEQGVRYATAEWIAEHAPVEVTIDVEDGTPLTLVEGSRYLCAPDAVDRSGTAVWLAFDDAPAEVRFRCMSATGDAIVSGTSPTGSRVTQYVEPRFLSAAPDAPYVGDGGWAAGQKWRVVHEAGSHGFPVGTIVTSLFEPNHPHRNHAGYFHATTLELDDYTRGARQAIGTTAWVNATVDHIGVANVERVPDEPEPSRVRDSVDVDALLAEIDEADETSTDLDDKRAAIVNLQQQVAMAEAEVTAARQERAEWIERLIERSRQVADEEGWCGVYDAGMRELGLPDRSSAPGRTREVEVTVYAECEVYVSLDENAVTNYLDGEGWEYSSVDSDTHTYTVNLDTLSTEVTVTVTADEDGDFDESPCACDEDVEWEHLLPAWVRDNGFDYDIRERECSND